MPLGRKADSDEASPDVWRSAAAWSEQSAAEGKPNTWFVTWKRADGVVAWAWQDALWNGKSLIVVSSDDAGREDGMW